MNLSPLDRLLPALSRWTAFLPAPARRLLRVLAFGGRSRVCPICHRSARRYLPVGVVPRPNAVCPWCGSLERHRLAWLYLEREVDLPLDGGRMLHVAPEPGMAAALERKGVSGVVTLDLQPGVVDVACDLTALSFPVAAFDLVYCSHVLEHIPDDRAAMREMHRILRPGGTLLVQVPTRGEQTYEDFGIVTPEGRLAAFGQHDHVRYYGADIANRLGEAGFAVTRVIARDWLAPEEIRRFSLGERETLFRCDRHD